MSGSPIHNRGVTFDGFEFLQKNIEYDDNGAELYIGLAAPGKTGSDEAWFIKKITRDISNRVTAIRIANNATGFTLAWDSRETYSYE